MKSGYLSDSKLIKYVLISKCLSNFKTNSFEKTFPKFKYLSKVVTLLTTNKAIFLTF